MPATRLQFETPQNWKPADDFDEFIAETGFLRDPDREFSRFMLDTFDWRLFAKGWILASDALAGRFKTSWQTREDVEILGVLFSEHRPKSIHDFPQGRMHNLLAPVLEVRALLPQMKLDCRTRSYRQKNKQDKTVLRLHLEFYTIHTPEREQKNLCARVFLESVRGYEKVFYEVAELLRKQPHLRVVSDHPWVKALQRVGRRPMDYSSKLELKLEPSMRADAALRIIFLRLFSIMENNEAGTVKNIDSEFLHDFRVAIRKTRALLSYSKSILPRARVDDFKREFAWLAKATGSTRDLDVHLANFEAYRKAVPVSIREDLEALYEILKKKQKEAQTELVAALASDRYESLKKRWKGFLDSPADEKPQELFGDSRVKQIADDCIWCACESIHRKGGAIGPQSAPQRLHRLRIHCKKLRYLLEFFESLYPEKPVRQAIRVLKGLQDYLGKFQDLAVQEASLREYGNAMMRTENSARSLLAMGVLVRELEKQREQLRREFDERFLEFDSRSSKKLFHSLFHATQEESSP